MQQSIRTALTPAGGQLGVRCIATLRPHSLCTTINQHNQGKKQQLGPGEAKPSSTFTAVKVRLCPCCCCFLPKSILLLLISSVVVVFYQRVFLLKFATEQQGLLRRPLEAKTELAVYRLIKQT